MLQIAYSFGPLQLLQDPQNQPRKKTLEACQALRVPVLVGGQRVPG
jgi:hypothetical protein